MTNWTMKEYKEYLAKRKMKYGNKKLEIDGHVFDSQREAGIYITYKAMKTNGVITELELQPKFLLQPSFKHNGKTVRAIYYVADFRLKYPDGHEEVVDVKSKATEKNAVYRLKRKMFLYKYPDVVFREVF